MNIGILTSILLNNISVIKSVNVGPIAATSDSTTPSVVALSSQGGCTLNGSLMARAQ